mmetsp:Transcript_10901/g.27488  ORF Transcript_10901/g.27488 Transcript_10901/m.27488 type:complete len:266 (-) Transcript_10901:401-1198(-)
MLLMMWQGRAWLCKVHLARRRPMLVLVLALVLALALTLALAQIQDVRQVQKFEKALCVRVLVVVNSAPGRKLFPEGALWRRRALEIILQGRKKKVRTMRCVGGRGRKPVGSAQHVRTSESAVDSGRSEFCDIPLLPCFFCCVGGGRDLQEWCCRFHFPPASLQPTRSPLGSHLDRMAGPFDSSPAPLPAASPPAFSSVWPATLGRTGRFLGSSLHPPHLENPAPGGSLGSASICRGRGTWCRRARRRRRRPSKPPWRPRGRRPWP